MSSRSRRILQAALENIENDKNVCNESSHCVYGEADQKDLGMDSEWEECIVSHIDGTVIPISTTDEAFIIEEEVEDSNVEHTSANPVMEVNTVQNQTTDVKTQNDGRDLDEVRTSIEQNGGTLGEGGNSSCSSSWSDSPVSRISKKRLKAKKSRVAGLSYVGYKKSDDGKIKQNCMKTSRSVKERCSHTLCGKKSERSFLCNMVSENDRQRIFKKFWNFSSWPEKKAFVKGLTSTRDVRRRRKDANNNSKKKEGHDIFLPKCNGERVRVCRRFFINTLDLGEDTFRRWVRRSDTFAENETERDDIPKRKKRTIAEGVKKKIHNEMKNNILKWLALLPKVPRHYCRSTSSCTYVESTFRSLSHMYSVYEDWCKSNDTKAASRTFFLDVLKQEKIKIHSPRKDQCDICCGYKVKSVSYDEYQKHIIMKNEARDAKNKAKAEANDTHLVLTMDLQSVLLCPKTDASRMYYKQKLQLHNFTIFVLNNKEVSLYVWHESNGGVSSNEFATCVIDFLSSCEHKYQTVTLISDGCTYQNRNKVLGSALRDYAVQSGILIRQLFLEKGHTMMECDSVHASLEKYFVPPINSPSDYIAQMRSARPKQPYKINVLDYKFFLNFEKLSTNLRSLRPGKKVGDPHVVDIRALEYRPTGDIFYKIRHSEEFEELPQRVFTRYVQKPPPLYSCEIPIAETKWKCLQELKGVIEEEHHHFYDKLTFKKDKNTVKKCNSNS
ncbi:unnamed protein product [Acanthoscelides obtectus]|uniref:Uncharacterized protein n=1 Tax=Acanthoscelides obtectus TaxID=200917 RepID=A0A9P0M0A3_ACAOB|nr:unnamed protein product [Acanthoscelides obtectus]CAK1622540.1 hypothetical protein AOBTE_LOCUS1549 [Acanthoscelides obtectus]